LGPVMFTEVEDRRQCPCDQLNRISLERREIVCISATETNEQKSGVQLVAILPHNLGFLSVCLFVCHCTLSCVHNDSV